MRETGRGVKTLDRILRGPKRAPPRRRPANRNILVFKTIRSFRERMKRGQRDTIGEPGGDKRRRPVDSVADSQVTVWSAG